MEKIENTIMLVDNNPYSPAQVFSVLDDGSRVVKLIYPEELFKLMGKVESAYNHKSACATTDNEQLFDALSALYNKHNFISQDELEKHLASIERKMNSLKKNGIQYVSYTFAFDEPKYSLDDMKQFVNLLIKKLQAHYKHKGDIPKMDQFKSIELHGDNKNVVISLDSSSRHVNVAV